MWLQWSQFHKFLKASPFFQVIFFKAVILKHILYYNVAFLPTLHSAHLQWRVHANSESYGPWLAEIFLTD